MERINKIEITGVVISISSLIIAVAALIVTVFATRSAREQVEIARTQTEMARAHNRASVVPMLQLTTYLEGAGGRNGVYISNDGLGPAILTDFSVKYGTTISSGLGRSNWIKVFEAAGLEPLCFAQGWPVASTVLKSGSIDVLLELTEAAGMENCTSQMIKLAQNSPIEITVEYQSIYGEGRTLKSSSEILLDSSSSDLLDILKKLVP